MTTVFDALRRLLDHYRSKMKEVDYEILKRTIEAMHDLQHEDNSHKFDNFIWMKIEEGFSEERKARWKIWLRGIPKK